MERARTVIDACRAPARRDRSALADAVATFDDLGALPHAERGRRWLMLLDREVGAAPTPAPRPRLIMMTDIVGSTDLNRRLGDSIYLEVLRAHNQLVRSALADHSGHELKQTGDGFNAWFASATDAVESAVAIQRRLARWNREHPNLPVEVRVGIVAGSPLDADDDLFGLSMSEASRVCARAGAGQILVTEPVRARATGGFAFRYQERLVLRGFDEPMTLALVVAD